MTNTEWPGADVLSMDCLLITGIRTASLVFRCHVRGLITDSAVPGGLRLAEDFAEPEPAPDECVVEVRAFSLNYGETILLKQRPDGWRPGQDVAGVVVRATSSGSTCTAGASRWGIRSGRPRYPFGQSRRPFTPGAGLDRPATRDEPAGPGV